MPIHHTTRKAAETAGVILTEENGLVKAFWAKMNRTTTAEDARQALQSMLLQQKFGAEFPYVNVLNEDNEVQVTIEGHEDVELPTFDFFDEDGKKVIFDVEDAFTAITDDDAFRQIVDEMGEASDEEEGFSGSVVGSTYRAKYAEEGHAHRCDDWLAGMLDGAFDVDDKFNDDLFVKCLNDNEVQYQEKDKWYQLRYNGHSSAVGRFRMNGGQKLRRRLAETGVLKLHGNEFTIPADAMEDLYSKFPAARPGYTKPKRQRAKKVKAAPAA